MSTNRRLVLGALALLLAPLLPPPAAAQDQTVTVEVLPDGPGEYEFTCGMNMYRGKLIAQ